MLIVATVVSVVVRGCTHPPSRGHISHDAALLHASCILEQLLFRIVTRSLPLRVWVVADGDFCPLLARGKNVIEIDRFHFRRCTRVALVRHFEQLLVTLR